MSLGVDRMSELFKAIGEPTRLRILVLLGRGDLTVSDLTQVLGQSQPRVSRHLKLLTEADIPIYIFKSNYLLRYTLDPNNGLSIGVSFKLFTTSFFSGITFFAGALRYSISYSGSSSS